MAKMFEKPKSPIENETEYKQKNASCPDVALDVQKPLCWPDLDILDYMIINQKGVSGFTMLA